MMQMGYSLKDVESSSREYVSTFSTSFTRTEDSLEIDQN